ncbi:MAG: helix-turn-helix transcriptional regulator [Acidimicrobiales bacterium]
MPRPDQMQAFVETFCSDHPHAVAEGRAMSMDAIVAYARRARGARGRPQFGWASLTPTERLVAELVAQGSTNAEIATALLMSGATVKSHLTHIYAKVGVRNRTALAAAHPGTTHDVTSIG